MGDSYSSGEGIPPYIGGDLGNEARFDSPYFLAHRSMFSWPGQIEIEGWSGNLESYRKDGRWHFVASSGAKIPDILGPDGQRKRFSIPQVQFDRMGGVLRSGSRTLPPQIDVFEDYNLYGEVDYVTLTIGGNDVGFASVMVAGIVDLPGAINTFAPALYLAEWRFNRLKSGGSFQEVYNQIFEAAGNQAKIIVAGYPPLIYEGRRSFGSQLLFSTRNARNLNASIKRVNADLENVVGSMNSGGSKNFYFVCVFEEFRTREAYSANPFIHGLIVPAGPADLTRALHSAASFHPNEDGARAYARVVNAAIAEIERSRSGSAGELTSFTHNTSMVFDVSGSMGSFALGSNQSKLASAQDAGEVIVSMARSQGDVGLGVVSFNHDAREEQALTANYDLVVDAIDGLWANSATNIRAGLELGVAQLENASGDRMMIFLSDGVDTVGNSYEDVMAAARRASSLDITIHVIGFGYDFDLDEPLLKSIANETGGTYVREDASSLIGLSGAYMRAQMSATSNVVLDGSDTINQGQTVEIGQFEVSAASDVRAGLVWPGSALDIILTDPNGVTAADGYPGFSVDNDSTLSQVVIEDAMRGTWDLSVYGADVSMDEMPFYVISALDERVEPEIEHISIEPTSIPETPTVVMSMADDNAGMLLLVLTAVVLASCGFMLFSHRKKDSDGKAAEEKEPRRIM